MGSADLFTELVAIYRKHGWQLRRALLRPETRVLYMSGYPDDATLHDGLEPDFSFLQKPFAPDELARKIRDILDGPRH